MEQPTNNERHTALGGFMDAWSKVEMAVSILLSEMLSTDLNNMPPLMNSLGSRGQFDVLNELGASTFDKAAFEELEKLTNRFKANNTRRNYITHGYWLLEILVRNHGGNPALVYQQIRAYSPTNRLEREKLSDRRNVKERTKYYFTLTRLRALTGELHRLWEDLGAFRSKYFGPHGV
ncbi:MAG: hypothetical protein JWO81_2774 [Alphaproteobacteria bacterium]|nr:hypothetical protein [Alphaproteobacteria bacterium]